MRQDLTTDANGQVTFDWDTLMGVRLTVKPRVEIEADAHYRYALSWATDASSRYTGVTVTATDTAGAAATSMGLRLHLIT